MWWARLLYLVVNLSCSGCWLVNDTAMEDLKHVRGGHCVKIGTWILNFKTWRQRLFKKTWFNLNIEKEHIQKHINKYNQYDDNLSKSYHGNIQMTKSWKIIFYAICLVRSYFRLLNSAQDDAWWLLRKTYNVTLSLFPFLKGLAVQWFDLSEIIKLRL